MPVHMSVYIYECKCGGGGGVLFTSLCLPCSFATGDNAVYVILLFVFNFAKLFF